MAFKVNGIEDQHDLKRAQAAAQAQGTTVTNYNEWAEIMKTLSEAGEESTGSYAGDKAKIEEMKKTVEDFINNAQIEQIAHRQKQETEQVKQTSESDRDQEIKATVANATSSMILADYMKYYHMMT